MELHQRHGKGKTRYWAIQIRDNVLSTQWGILGEDGRKQEHGSTQDTIPAKGKPGTAAFMGETENALFNMKREIRKKMEEGYENPLDSTPKLVKDQILHTKPLPKNLAFCKPSKKPSKKVMGRHDIIATVKFNGETVIAHKMADGRAAIYSRRMIDITAWFPQLANFIESPDVPLRSILMFEGHMSRGATRKDAIKAASIFRSKAPLALSKQEAEGWMKFYLFRVPIWDGEPYEQQYPAEQQLAWMEEVVNPLLNKKEHKWEGQKVLVPIQVLRNLTVDSALEYARLHKLEGLVGYLPEGILAVQAWSFHGKPDRPNHFFKLKLDEEDDFIVRFHPLKGHGTWGTGKNQQRVGTLAMFQLNEAGGEEIYCGDVGVGISDPMRDRIADLMRINDGWVGVAEVHFETRFFVSAGDKSNAVQIPRIHRLRGDKDPSECICESLTAEPPK